MKVLIYKRFMSLIKRSGIGQAILHQEKMLALAGMDYTTDPREGYDIVHMNTVLPDALIASKWAKWRGKKVVYYGHSTMEDFRNSFIGSNQIAPLFKKWISYCYNSGDVIITPTEYSKSILEQYDLKPAIYSLSNGIDTTFFSKSEEDRQAFRQRYGIREDQKVVISVGHYIKRKGILEFVELAKAMPEYEFYWFGYTNPSLLPKEVKEALETKCENLHFPGYIDRQALKEAYSGGDLFLFLTHEETEGIVLLEALSMEIPILVRDIPIYASWLPEGEVVYKARSTQEFKGRIKQILEGETEDLRSKGRQLAQKKDLGHMGQALEAIYSQL